MAKRITEIAIISLAVGFLTRDIAFGQTAVGADKQAPFLAEMSRWVGDTLRVSDPDKARYVMGRTGCAIVIKKDANDKSEFLPLTDQIKKCAREIGNFDCRATVSLVKDAKVTQNKYYDYCKSR